MQHTQQLFLEALKAALKNEQVEWNNKLEAQEWMDLFRMAEVHQILLLDEATSALDVTTERKVLRNIIEQKPNKTCIVTTHRPSVLNMCQRVYRVMETKVTELDEEESSRMAMDF